MYDSVSMRTDQCQRGACGCEKGCAYSAVRCLCGRQKVLSRGPRACARTPTWHRPVRLSGVQLCVRVLADCCLVCICEVCCGLLGPTSAAASFP